MACSYSQNATRLSPPLTHTIANVLDPWAAANKRILTHNPPTVSPINIYFSLPRFQLSIATNLNPLVAQLIFVEPQLIYQ